MSLGDYFQDSVGKLYSDLVPLVIENEMIPLALYRKCPDSRLFYTVTNPSPETKLADTDYVMVINVGSKQKSRRTTFFSPGMSSAQAMRMALSADTKDNKDNQDNNNASPKQNRDAVTKTPSEKDKDKKKKKKEPKKVEKKPAEEKKKPAEEKKEETESESDSDSSSSYSSDNSNDQIKLQEKSSK